VTMGRDRNWRSRILGRPELGDPYRNRCVACSSFGPVPTFTLLGAFLPGENRVCVSGYFFIFFCFWALLFASTSGFVFFLRFRVSQFYYSIPKAGPVGFAPARTTTENRILQVDWLTQQCESVRRAPGVRGPGLR